MLEDQKDDGYGSVKLPIGVWVLIGTSLFSGIGSGVFTVATRDEIAEKVVDRYYGRDALKDFAIRDIRIHHLEQQFTEHKASNAAELTRLNAELEAAKHTHPPPVVAKALNELDKRLREVELEEARRGK